MNKTEESKPEMELEVSIKPHELKTLSVNSTEIPFQETSEAEELSLPCTVCPQTFNSILKFKKHIRTHTGELMYDCYLCDESFGTLREQKLHVKHHENGPNRHHKCDVCSAKLGSSVHLKSHLMIHTGEKPYECKICSARFRHKISLDRHGWTHRKDRPLEFKCKICPQAFPTKDHLSRHTANHTGKKNYQCPMCPKSFFDSSILKRHILTHTGERNHHCNICSLSFKRKHHLEQHQRSHTGKGKNSYKCDLCRQSFPTSNARFTHVKIAHPNAKTEANGDKKNPKPNSGPLTCKICSLNFKSELNLNNHMRKHTGEGAYKCEICNTFLMNKIVFDRHMKKGIHRPGKIYHQPAFQGYRCGLCDIFLIQRTAFEKHMEEHMQFSCKVCKMDFAVESDYEIHLEVHRDEKPSCRNCGQTCDSHKEFSLHLMEFHGLPVVPLAKKG